MAEIIVLQSSLSKSSRTAVVVKEVQKVLKKKNVDFETIDLRDLDMQFCDGRSLEEYNQNTQDIHKKLLAAKGFIIGMPVYNYSFSGVLKNFIDIHSKAFDSKFFGIVANSGGVRSYLASAELMKALSFEVSSMGIQPTVHTWKGDFEDGKLKNDKVIEKIATMSDVLLNYVRKTK